mgnify:CR=1 FL=1
MTPKIEVVNGSFSYNHKDTIWENVNLQVNEGDCVCLLGANGCGVTSILVKAIDNHNFWLKARHVLEKPFIFAARKKTITQNRPTGKKNNKAQNPQPHTH